MQKSFCKDEDRYAARVDYEVPWGVSDRLGFLTEGGVTLEEEQQWVNVLSRYYVKDGKLYDLCIEEHSCLREDYLHHHEVSNHLKIANCAEDVAHAEAVEEAKR